MIANRTFITDDEVDRALDYMRDNADEAARAKAERAYVTEYRKVLKAQIMKEHDKLSAVLQEREAYADPRYLEHLAAIRDAVFNDERMGFLREAAKTKVDAWQTQSANERAIKL